MADVVLTLEQCDEMERTLMEEYKKASFQQELRVIWDMTKNDEIKRIVMRQAATFPIQMKVLPKFGFEASKEGIKASMRAVMGAKNGELDDNHWKLTWLVTPDEQDAKPGFVEGAEIPAPTPPEEPDYTDSDLYRRWSSWVVVGGEATGGLRARIGEALSSRELRSRVETGSRLRAEQEVNGNRLHYKLLSGSGPEFGWVTIKAKDGRWLVRPDI